MEGDLNKENLKVAYDVVLSEITRTPVESNRVLDLLRCLVDLRGAMIVKDNTPTYNKIDLIRGVREYSQGKSCNISLRECKEIVELIISKLGVFQ